MTRVYNFSAGPAALPLPVLERIRDEMLELPGAGASILEISHRSKSFEAIIAHAETLVRELLGLPENFHVLFLQGGASQQFSMVPMNFLATDNPHADYIINGIWAQKALKEAEKVGAPRAAASSEAGNFKRVPSQDELRLNPTARYVHFTSNETIFGIRHAHEPETNGVPLVADASSDILSRRLDLPRYGLIYAGAQKNIGPSGVTLVLVRDDFVGSAPANLATMLSYRAHIKAKSLYNTPNTFGIYVIGLVCEHLKTLGGLDEIEKLNAHKASVLYAILDGGDFYRGHAEAASRSHMNVTFRLPDESLEKKFIAEANAQGLAELKGHRDVGGIRASIYNAMPLEGVEALAAFMREFERVNG